MKLPVWRPCRSSRRNYKTNCTNRTATYELAQDHIVGVVEIAVLVVLLVWAMLMRFAGGNK